MHEDHLSALRLAVSQERLDPYCHPNDDDDLHAFGRYMWNTALSESLYPALQSLEIALRNSIHKAATNTFGTEFWFDANSRILKSREQDKVRDAKTKLQRENKPLTSGRIIAEFTFGFWTSLLNSRYEQVLWPKIMKTAFPHTPNKQRNRKAIVRELEPIRRLRNRVFHHEPIWHWKDLDQKHASTLMLTRWISPTLSDTIANMDRFPEVHKGGYEPYRARLSAQINQTGA